MKHLDQFHNILWKIKLFWIALPEGKNVFHGQKQEWSRLGWRYHTQDYTIKLPLSLRGKPLLPHRVLRRFWMPGPPCSNWTNGFNCSRSGGTTMAFETILPKCRPYSHFNIFPKIYGLEICQFDQNHPPCNVLFPLFSFLSLFWLPQELGTLSWEATPTKSFSSPKSSQQYPHFSCTQFHPFLFSALLHHLPRSLHHSYIIL